MPRYEIERPRDLGSLIAMTREERGISQEELAEQLGFSRSYLSELESGRSTLQLARIFRALHALDATVEVVVMNPPRGTSDD
jgi:HTH-type transcriptional regulator / antitoxin HipB